MQTSAYELRIYDDTLLWFTWETDNFGQTHVGITGQNTTKTGLLPPGLMLDRSSRAMRRWLDSRVIPKNRSFVEAILATQGLAPGDTKGIVDVCKGLSVNDAYWVVPAGFGGTWEENNLYDNPLDNVLSLVAYTGHSTGQRRKAGLSTEWTTDGTYPKAWRRIDGKLVLYKGPNPVYEGTANADMGVWSDYLASQVADALEVPHVTYDLDEWEGSIASTCKLLNDANTALVPYHAAAQNAGYANVINTYAQLGMDWLESAVNMFMFDAVICNTDRHAGNHSVLRDNHTGAWMGPAPLFDHNLALFPNDMPADFPAWERVPDGLARFPSNARISFDTVMGQMCTRVHHEWGRRLVGMRLRNHPRYPMPVDRLRAIERFLHAQGRRILAKQPQSLDAIAATFARSMREEPDEPCPLLDGAQCGPLSSVASLG